jgi:hypothetical protein
VLDDVIYATNVGATGNKCVQAPLVGCEDFQSDTTASSERSGHGAVAEREASKSRTKCRYLAVALSG